MILLFTFLMGTRPAFAQWHSMPWLHAEGTYVQRTTKEDGGPSLLTTRAGARGELGLALSRYLAVSAGGSYHDGGGTTSDSTATTHFAGYTSDTRALVHIVYRPLVFSTGLAQYENFETLPTVYRARTSLSYKPMQLTAFWGAVYLRYELDVGAKGSVSRTYSDQGGARQNLKFKLGKVRGQGAEVGVILPSTKYSTKLFVNWAKWTLDAVDPVSDGVEDRRVGRTEATTVMGGLGLAF